KLVCPAGLRQCGNVYVSETAIQDITEPQLGRTRAFGVHRDLGDRFAGRVGMTCQRMIHGPHDISMAKPKMLRLRRSCQIASIHRSRWRSVRPGIKRPLRIHREGWPFIAVFAAINALLLAWSPWPAALFLPLTLWCVAFFRDPDRRAPGGPGLVVSPADGRLLPVTRGIPPTELGLGLEPRQRLSVFMSVFNVHVNRIPAPRA